jgi:hypothetical protein
MKTFTIIAIVVMAIFSISATPIAEIAKSEKQFTKAGNGFSFIRSHRQGRGATVTWAYGSANASTFALQRTYEDPSDPYSVWEPVCSITCNNSRSYKHTDEGVFPGLVNYRVVALLNDGNTEMSAVTTVRIVQH